MRKLLSLFFLIFSLSTSAQPQPNYTRLADHPRLILKSGNIDSLKKKIDTDAALYRMHAHIEERADRHLSSEPSTYIKRGRRLLGVSRMVLERVCYCTYMYLISGDELYARRAEKEMLAAASFTDWNPSHFLDTAEMTAALALGYDWLYTWLSPDSRKIIEDAIIEKGLGAANTKMWWYRSENNWNQVCNGGMVMGALAVFERIPEEAKEHIERALQSNPKSQGCYGPHGIYPEGFGYWEYGTWYEVMLIESLRTALGDSFGLEKHPGFLESAKFMNFMQTPTGYTFNFADSGNPADIINPLLYWFAYETGDTSLVAQDRRTIIEKERVRGINRQAPLAMIFASRCSLKQVEPIDEVFWSGQGKQPLFLYRSGFSSDKDSYLAAKGGSPSTNHAHMDSGSFIYEWGGVQWASDLGSQDYHSLESKGIALWKRGQNSQRWQVYRLSNFPHNTLTVNDAIHQVKGMATMDEVYNTNNRHGAKFNLSSLFTDLASAYRTIYIDKSYKVVCIDQLVANNVDCNVRWNMTTMTKATIINDKTISLRRDGKEVILRVLSPKGAKAYIMSNNPETSYDATNKGSCRVGFNIEVAPSSKCIIKVELEPQK